MSSKRRRVIVLYGGRSAEHEISCRSAAFVLKNLDPAKYDVVAVAIDKDGRWLPQNTRALLDNLSGPVPIDKTIHSQPALPTRYDPGAGLLALAGEPDGSAVSQTETVVFPVLHGTNGEDGTLQGLLEMTEVAYVGPGHLGSAIGMDKAVAKKLVAAAGVPVVPWVDAHRELWEKYRESYLARARELGFPLFVKPANLGSSVGISKVRDAQSLEAACEEAFRYDEKILIEKGLEVREIECAVLGGHDPEVSVPGEVIPRAEFYTYEAKYLDPEGADLAVPANLEPAQAEEARRLAKLAFQAMELYGMARVDLFLDKRDGTFYFNEVNTIPGFTEISQFPMLWKASGVSPQQLVDRLIDLAVERRRAKARLKRAR